MRGIAVTAQRRASSLADVPAMSEAGLPDFEITSWFGLLAPAGKATLGAQGLEVAPDSPEQ
jgi:tripartite-type tricarboxylate transporter receptor subunit TctC